MSYSKISFTIVQNLYRFTIVVILNKTYINQKNIVYQRNIHVSLTERRVGSIPDKACKQLFTCTQIKLLPPRFFNYLSATYSK